MPDEVKVSVTLPKDVVDKIKQLARDNHTTAARAIIESVELNDLLTRQERQGAVIVVDRRDRTMQRVLRPRVE